MGVWLDGAALRAAVSEVYTTRVLQEVLDRVRTGDELFRFLSRFVQYSSPSGWSQAVLAGSMALRADLFREAGEVPAFSDRSVDVAAGVFYGAIDEFGDRDVSGVPHRRMALALLAELARYLDIPRDVAWKVMHAHGPTNEAIAGVLNGYGVGRLLDDRAVFRGFGFHLGTEVVADETFNVIDRHLRRNFPDVVEHLTGTRVAVGSAEIDAYTYIQRHTTAEGDHFEAAIAVVDRAIALYAGSALTKAEVVACVVDGAVQLGRLESLFMSSVLESGSRASVAPAAPAASL
jgi:hypothetical protein